MERSGTKAERKNTTALAAALFAALGLLFCAGCAQQSAPPSEEGAASPAARSAYAGKLRIAELMVKNHATLTDENGAFTDWVELENTSDAELDIGGFTLSDGEEKSGWTLPAYMLEPGGRLLVFTGGEAGPGGLPHADFSLSPGETLCLRDAGGAPVDTVLCTTEQADAALCRDESGAWRETSFATPGYPNTAQGYEDWQQSLPAPDALRISEAVTADSPATALRALAACDWVELRNASAGAVELSDYYLSDDEDDLTRWRFPQRTLAPGERVIVVCGEDEQQAGSGFLYAPFGLSADGEALFLSGNGGRVCDFVYLHDLPQGGSMGRMEGQNGWFYFAVPQPGTEKSGGARRMTQMPVTSVAPGVYNDVQQLRIELSGEGEIYYTTDGSLPDEGSVRYQTPITLTGTTMLRAVAVAPGALPSRALTCSYWINENHSLPVASLVTDDPDAFDRMYHGKRKDLVLTGNLSFYGETGGFSLPCGVEMHGQMSLDQVKKNMGLRFRGTYGQSSLEYDLFDGGITHFTDLLLRAGQDQTYTVVRNELLENLCLQYSDAVPTQRSKHCVLYINGEYRGIYALMEKVNEQHYAGLMGVDKDSVHVEKAWASPGSVYYQSVICFAQENDLRQEEAYARFCELVDIDSLIDWMIIEGYSANTDITDSNLRYARSTQGDGKWRFVLYDMDATLNQPGMIFANVLRPASTQNAVFITPLLENESFRARFLTRAGEVLSTTLSNENVEAELMRLAGQIAPEVARDAAINRRSQAQWEAEVESLRRTITEGDWNARCIEAIRKYMGLSEEELSQYFGGT